MGFLDRFKKEKEQQVENAGTRTKATEELLKEADKKETTKVKSEKVSTDLKKKTAKTEKPKKITKTKTRTDVPENLSDIIVRPLVTEKAAELADSGKYVFVVKKDANRIEVRNAVKAVYGVLPIKINIQRVRGDVVRFGRTRGKQKGWKKAIVTLPKDKKINVYEGV